MVLLPADVLADQALPFSWSEGLGITPLGSLFQRAPLQATGWSVLVKEFGLTYQSYD